MTTTIELKEQMKELRYRQREAEKKKNQVIKDYKIYQMLIAQHPAFRYVSLYGNKFDTFEELIIETKWTNSKFKNREEFEFLFNHLGYTDIEFFRTFMEWPPLIFNSNMEDRKCCVCMEYYNARAKTKRKFNNCVHAVCLECYSNLQKVSGYKSCVVCRQSEKPVIVSAVAVVK